MKNLPVKIASVAVIASMALSFAACSKKGGTDSRTESHSGDKIAADSPWFDSKTIDVDVNVDSSRKVDYASTSLVGAETTDEILNKITEFTTKKIKANTTPLNRAQRRALAKKVGKKNREDINTIADTAEKLNYIDLIQKLRKLNEKREREENGETTTENN